MSRILSDVELTEMDVDALLGHIEVLTAERDAIRAICVEAARYTDSGLPTWALYKARGEQNLAQQILAVLG
jgi:hypothetical protein